MSKHLTMLLSSPLLFLLIINCTTPAAHFRHDLDNKNMPWKHERFDDNEDKITFVIFCDLTDGEQFPEKGRSMDHLMLVTVDDAGVTIANLPMNGILDKTGHIPSDDAHLQ
jgi:hypothetical protein